jgi:hypothetical protein
MSSVMAFIWLTYCIFRYLKHNHIFSHSRCNNIVHCIIFSLYSMYSTQNISLLNFELINDINSLLSNIYWMFSILPDGGTTRNITCIYFVSISTKKRIYNDFILSIPFCGKTKLLINSNNRYDIAEMLLKMALNTIIISCIY